MYARDCDIRGRVNTIPLLCGGTAVVLFTVMWLADNGRHRVHACSGRKDRSILHLGRIAMRPYADRPPRPARRIGVITTFYVCTNTPGVSVLHSRPTVLIPDDR